MCNAIKWSFAAAFALALFLLAVGTWGWLGAERDSAASADFLSQSHGLFRIYVADGDVKPLRSEKTGEARRPYP